MVQILLKALGSILMKLFAAAATEEVVEWLVFKAAETAVKSTKTTVDDEGLAKLKAAYKDVAK